jgi:hypothetical protein
MGSEFRICEFCFFFLVFFLPSVAPEGMYSVWSAEGLSSTFGAGSQWAGGWVTAWWAGGPASRLLAGRWAVVA